VITGLQQSVIDRLPSVFGQWEGPGLPYPYTDSKGLVTIGTGNLIDPLSSALALPFYMPDGSAASPAQIAADWQRVKSAFPAVQSTACARLTSIRLHADGLAHLLLNTVASMWHVTCSLFAAAPTWPADAQLAILSIDWAWGPYFPVVWNRIGGAPLGYGDAFKLQCGTPDFDLAAGVMLDASKHEETINAGIVPRDRGTVVMFRNAQAVIEDASDRSKLWYPLQYPLVAA
jgi:hypothetical protein